MSFTLKIASNLNTFKCDFNTEYLTLSPIRLHNCNNATFHRSKNSFKKFLGSVSIGESEIMRIPIERSIETTFTLWQMRWFTIIIGELRNGKNASHAKSDVTRKSHRPRAASKSKSAKYRRDRRVRHYCICLLYRAPRVWINNIYIEKTNTIMTVACLYIRSP